MVQLAGEEVRTNWRDTIDRVYRGETIIVLRYGKPVAVIMSVEELERLQEGTGEPVVTE